MVDVVPIQVIIGLKPNGFADYPDWTQLPLQRVRGERHEDHQIVKWVYDKTSGHDDVSPGSPRGTQLGMMLVTQTFADEAVAAFPGVVSVLTEAAASTFWDTMAHAHIAADAVDTNHLIGLKMRRELLVDLGQSTTTLDVQISKALDPNDTERGVRKNKRKTWTGLKADIGVVVR